MSNLLVYYSNVISSLFICVCFFYWNKRINVLLRRKKWNDEELRRKYTIYVNSHYSIFDIFIYIFYFFLFIYLFVCFGFCNGESMKKSIVQATWKKYMIGFMWIISRIVDIGHYRSNLNSIAKSLHVIYSFRSFH